jgi:hypothetical protein
VTWMPRARSHAPAPSRSRRRGARRPKTTPGRSASPDARSWPRHPARRR